MGNIETINKNKKNKPRMSVNFKFARQRAEKLLKDLCLVNPPVPILEVCETEGIQVFETEFKNKGESKISGLIDIDKKIIYVERRDHVTHKRFTIAHELGHWLLHPHYLLNDEPALGVYFRRPIGGETDDREKEANCFAANLLVPMSMLQSLQDFYTNEELARIFGVSTEVIRYRLVAIGLNS